MTRRFKVQLEQPLDGSHEATITIEPGLSKNYFSLHVRPKGKHKQYTMPLGMVASLVAWRVAKLDEEAHTRT